VRHILYLFILCCPLVSKGGVLIELGGVYLTDTTVSSSTEKSTKYFYQAGLLFDIQKKFWGGWNYSGISNQNSGTTDTSFISSDTGPYIKWQFGRGQLYSLSAAYNILSRADYKSGTDTERWEGTSYWIQFGVMPELAAGFHLGASLNYYSANYTKKIISGTETNDSNSKTWIFPMLSLTKQW
jgi:hypothetical protein